MTSKIHASVHKKDLLWSLLFVSLILCITVAYFQYEKTMFLNLTSEINSGNISTMAWAKYWKNMAYIRITYTASLLAATLLYSLTLARIIWRKRLSQLEVVTELASAGDLSCRLEIPKDEWETLAQRFNNMSFHLANLVDTVKTSTADWQKAVEKLAETLEVSAQARNNFSQHLTYVRESAQEQLNVLIQSITLAGKISEGLKRLDERQKISSQWSSECRGMISETASILGSVTRQLREFRSAFNKGLEYYELILSQGEPWSHHMTSLKSLIGQLASFIIEVALEAAKS
ncbi:MAG: methyl-accepting chemotaxis protein, partial [Thermanaeromonas sp.]|uniref:methyl-accepting chemotaxis protein n=1 Tax=Thermanaeromonas sp. TaxID=2003697 RepID=UPI00243C20CB